MRNKTLAIINLLCILAPMLLGATEELTGNVLTNGLLIVVLGLLMIIFGIWTSLRLAKQPD
jgi:cyanate permease